MSVLRFLSTLILIAFFITSGTALAGQESDSHQGSYAMGINLFFYCYAWAENDDATHEGWYHVWAHCGWGGNDYKSGSYRGTLAEYAFSLHITNRTRPILPDIVWVSDYIN